MVSKSMVQTFSYPVEAAEMIEEATKMAKADGISFSEFIVSLLEQEVRKKGVGEPDPLNLNRILRPQKSSLGTLDRWIHLTDAIQESKKIPEDQLYMLQAISTNTEKAYWWRKTGKVKI